LSKITLVFPAHANSSKQQLMSLFVQKEVIRDTAQFISSPAEASTAIHTSHWTNVYTGKIFWQIS
jgi:hypothetical protein